MHCTKDYMVLLMIPCAKRFHQSEIYTHTHIIIVFISAMLLLAVYLARQQYY